MGLGMGDSYLTRRRKKKKENNTKEQCSISTQTVPTAAPRKCTEVNAK